MKELIEEGDYVFIDMKNKGVDFWCSKVVMDSDPIEPSLMLEDDEVYIDCIPDKWILNIFNI